MSAKQTGLPQPEKSVISRVFARPKTVSLGEGFSRADSKKDPPQDRYCMVPSYLCSTINIFGI